MKLLMKIKIFTEMKLQFSTQLSIKERSKSTSDNA